jgi:hypothetical protein
MKSNQDFSRLLLYTIDKRARLDIHGKKPATRLSNMHQLMGELPEDRLDFLGILYDDHGLFSLLFPGHPRQFRFTVIGTGGPHSIGLEKQTADLFLKDMFGLLRTQENNHRGGPGSYTGIFGTSRAIVHPEHSEEFIQAAKEYGYVLEPLPDANQTIISF